jgi:hypothetical protein
MITKIKEELEQFYPADLVTSLIDSYVELAGNFMRGKLRPSQVEGGRFCEAAIRMIQHEATKTYSPIGVSINLDNEIEKLKNLPKTSYNDSIRLHIPRTIRVIYDIRSKRDTAHLGKISPNLMDATLILNCCKWVLAEFFRMKFKISINAAQGIIDGLVKKDIPLIQDFDGFPVILQPDMSIRDRIMILSYNRGPKGVKRQELSSWIAPKMRKQIATNLSRLQHDRSYIHRDGDWIYITRAGEQYVEENIFLSRISI